MPNLPRNLRSPKTIIIAVLVVIGIIALLVIQSRRMKATSLDKQAQSLSASGNFGDAQKKLNDALALDSTNAKILADTITAIAAEGNASGKEAEAQVKAKPYLDQALKSNTNSAELLTAIGYLYETGGQYQSAVDYYDKALKIKPKSGRLLFRKAHALQFLNGNTKEVQDLYDQAYKYDQKDPLILMFQARKYAGTGDLEHAYNLFIYAAQNSLQNNLKAEAYVSAYQIRDAQGKYDESKILAARAVNADRSFGPGLVYYGMALAREGNLKDAGGYIAEAISKNPRASMPYWYLGTLTSLATNYKQAIIYLQMGIDKIDNDNTILGVDTKKRTRALMTYDLGKIYYTSGDATKAFAVFTDAASFDKTAVSGALKSALARGLYKDISGDSRFAALIR